MPSQRCALLSTLLGGNFFPLLHQIKHYFCPERFDYNNNNYYYYFK
jgi:hypothetical protein